MARPKIVRTSEEAAAVPLDRPVSIELTPEQAATPPTLPNGAPPPPVAAEEPELPEVESPPLAVEPEPEEIEPAPENPLAKQLEELKAAEQRAQQELLQARQRETQAAALAAQREQELWRERQRSDEANYDSVLNAIGACQSEADRAQADLAAAMSAQDFQVVAEAQRRLSMATTRLVQYENDKAALDARREHIAQQPPPAADPIDGNPNLSQRQKSWLRAHPDAFTDPAKNAYLGAAHWKAQAAGHVVDSDAYFQAIEIELGYRQPAPAPAVQQKSIPMSAPTSREAPSLSGGPAPSPSRITLTKEQREAARIAGLDEVTYAKNVIRLNELKKQGHYQERG